MSIDLTRFIQAFLDESFEGLDQMESELLGADILDAKHNGERINTIFRAAHSIKGSAGTFGFPAIGEFTHGVETLLDQIRAGQRALTEEARALLLDAVDRIREMLVAARDGTVHDTDPAERTRRAIDALLDTQAPRAVVPAPAAASIDEANALSFHRWEVAFSPHAGLLATGNDPLRIFAYLRELGELTVRCETDALPALDGLEPESCYLRWTLELSGAITEAQVREAFEWVEGQCDLRIAELGVVGAAHGAPAHAAGRATANDPKASDPTESKPAAIDGTESEDLAAEAPAQQEAVALVTNTAVKEETAADRRHKSNADRRADSSSIRVAVDKVDSLVDLVGELVISQAMLATIGQEAEAEDFDDERVERLREGLAQLERNTRELQEAVLSVRMIPINFVFSRFPRLVRDLASTLGKKVDLVIDGEETELDRGVIEKLVDPLTHIVRNSIDHGIEQPAARAKAGKPETGTLRLKARHQGGNIVIEVSDDGAGLNRDRILSKAAERGLYVPENPTDREVWQLVCAPGFSTAEKITDISGRGVGMDVVRQNIESINGRLDIESSAGGGTRITIRLPLTLAILDGLSVRVGEEIFILPLTAILESLQPRPEQLHSISGRGRVVRLRGEYLPLVSLSEVFNLQGRYTRAEDGIVVVVESANERAALFVDELIAQHQVVIKSLEKNYRRVPGVSGATIMGDGRVALILDVDMLTQIHGRSSLVNQMGELHERSPISA